MCSSCDDIESKIRKAHAEGNAEKERVMRALLKSHMEYTHPRKHSIVVVDTNVIIWPSGQRWIVR